MVVRPGFRIQYYRSDRIEGRCYTRGGRPAVRRARAHRSGTTVWALTREGDAEHYVDESPVHPADVRTGHFITSREENSPFVNHLMVMRHMPHAHVTLTEAARTTRAPGRATEHTKLSVAEVIDTVLELGIALDRSEIRALSSVVERLRSRS